MTSLRYLLVFIVSFSLSSLVFGQHSMSLDAYLHPEDRNIEIHQLLRFENTSKDTLKTIYLTDWANSFSSKTTPLARRFAENFDSSFHFEKNDNRGGNKIQKITYKNGSAILWERGGELDIIKLPLQSPLYPGESVEFVLDYVVKVPEDKFTRYGVNPSGDYKLRYWFIAPAVYDGGWQYYSNKNTDDFFMLPSELDVTFHFPEDYRLVSDLDQQFEQVSEGSKVVHLKGSNRMQAPIYLDRTLGFQSIETDQFEVITDIRDKKVTPYIKALQVDRITRFLEEKLGPYPFDKMVISDADYRNSPVYGLNQLPDFISPFPNGFEMDMELLKTITREFLENTLPINPRKDYWLHGALQIQLMIDYVDSYYPNTKILGDLSNMFIVRWSHASELNFNDQYPFLYLNMARNNLHQPLVTPKDSLLKFNKNIANDYYAGAGLEYMGDYIGKEALDRAIRDYYQQFQLKPSTPEDFEGILEGVTDLPINWYFEDYAKKRTTIDFKIQSVVKHDDSLVVTVKNNRNNTLPVSLYGVNKKQIVYKTWLDPIDTTRTITIPREGIRRLSLNYEGVIPEYNRRNNFKKVEGLFNRPLQFRLFKDIEDPRYNQVFFMPVFSYNLYDGFSLGPKVYNKSFLPKGFHYRLEPMYGFRSKTIVGKGSLTYTDLQEDSNLYYVRYGISGNYFSYDSDLFYKRLSPFVVFAFRDKTDLRKNRRHFINLRSVTVTRDENPENPSEEPNYNIVNGQYVFSDNNLIDYYRSTFDFQIAKRFTKFSAQFEYRKLFLSNRQVNIRFFGGLFLRNDTETNDDFFSFALDRPTDYLFDYNYYGRSESQGLFSQQLIIAEGGFKSKLEPAFANEWIMTLNASSNIWKWVFVYADLGMVKNTGYNAKVVYDAGVRASLVADYFEIYFPLYSNLGWEPGLEGYDTRVRFIVTLDLKTLFGLFTREWY